MKKIIQTLLLFFLFPAIALAQEDSLVSNSVNNNTKKEKIFKAQVLEIVKEEEKSLGEDGFIIQQNIKLLGLEGELKDKELFFYGIGDLEVIGVQRHKAGDKVLLAAIFNNNEESYDYYIIDSVRSGSLFFIIIFFLFFLILIGRWKGLCSIFSLFLTFLIIIFFIIPKIMAGISPVLVVTIGSIFIIFCIIYLTEGFNLRSHLAAGSIFISLIFTIAISSLFVFLTKLTGAFNEDVFVLLNVGQESINLKGMLLAGMIVGALGVLDDVVISQVVTVEEITTANPYQSVKEVFRKAYNVGVSHISSMTNTLFLAYAGASLPLLILFVSPDNPFTSLEQIFNNEAVSTEIVRALSGSLGIIFSVPLSTFLAAWFFVKKQKNKI